MKHFSIFIAAMISVLLMGSCQKSQFAGDAPQGDLVTVTLNVQAPATLATKAIGDGQTADNLVFAVYDDAGVELTDLRQGDWTMSQPELVFDNSAKPQLTLTTTLVRGKEYTFVCWAQNKNTTCYDFSDMKEIKVDYSTAVAQDETRDAFYAAEFTGKITDHFSKTITLKRPFAQVNVGTADAEAAEKAGLDLNALHSTMTIENAATTLHTFDGKVSGNETVTFAIAPDPDEVLTINAAGYEGATYTWLAMNYFLVNDGATSGTGSVNGADQVNTTVSFKIFDGTTAADELCAYEVTNVPVQRNYRSHILGNLLTADGTITVVIEPDFLNPDYVVGL